MTTTIRTALSGLHITITDKTIAAFETLVRGWELRRTHPIALNSQTIGVHAIAFTPEDRVALFATFGIDEQRVRSLTQRLAVINQDFKVRSDPFNILAIWLIHMAYRAIEDPAHRARFQLTVAQYLHYRFFTSLVNHYFSYGATEKYMLAAVNSLSRRFDIITHGTWRAVIEERCKDLLSQSSIHRHALETADDDEMFLRVIQDLQSRIRDKIKNITRVYFEARERGDVINSRSATVETENGTELVQSARTLDIMIYNLQNEILSARLFVNDDLVRKIAAQFNAVSPDMLRATLLRLVEIAETQRDSKQLDLVRTNDGLELFVGLRALLTHLIQKTYRYCMRNGVDITNQAAVYLKVKNIFTSSRINDDDILAVKQSVSYFVDLISTSRRETTNSSLRIGVILYIITRSFRFL